MIFIQSFFHGEIWGYTYYRGCRKKKKRVKDLTVLDYQMHLMSIWHSKEKKRGVNHKIVKICQQMKENEMFKEAYFPKKFHS